MDERLHLVIESLGEFFVLCDAEDRIVMRNQRFVDMNRAVVETTVAGARFEDHLRALLARGILGDAIGREEEWLQNRLRQHRNPDNSFEVRRSDGSWVLIREQLLADGSVFTFGLDITERKRAEQALTRQKDLYNALSQTNQAIVRGTGREELFHALCRIAVEHGHFRFSWIGLIDRNDKRVKPVAQYGEDAGYVKQLEVSIDETVPGGAGRTGRALRTGRPVVGNDFGDERAKAPSRNRDAARRAGVRAYGAFPIRQGGVVAGVINFYAAEAGFFTEDLIATLEEMAQDLSFALDNFEREAERARAEQALRESEARYRSVFTNSNVTMLLIDPADGRIVDANYAASAYYGWDLPALQGMTIKDINTLSPEQVQANLDRVREEENIHFEFRHRLANGEVRDVEIFSGPVAVGGRKLRLSVIHDVTERLRARHELAESEDRFRGLVEQSIVGIYIVQDDKIAYVNRRFAEICGYESPDELIGRDSLSLVVENDRSVVQDIMRRRIESGVPSVSYGFTARRKDGSTVEVGIHSASATHRGRAAFIGLFQDISESKRAQEALRESEARFRDLVENSYDLMCTHDLEGKLLSLNAAAVRLTGYSSEALLRMNLADLLDPAARDLFAAYLSEIRTQGAASGIMRIRTASGEVRWWEYHNTLRTADVAVPMVRGVAQDITERKRAEQALRESEESLRAIFEGALDGMLVADAESRKFLTGNPTICRMLGYTLEELLRLSVPDIHPERDLPHVMEEFDRQRRGESHLAADIPVMRKDGSMFYADIRTARVRIGGRNGLLGIFRDITERKRAQEALRESEARFRSLTEMSSDFYWESDAEHRLTKLGSGGTARGVPALQQGARIGKRRWEMPYLAPDEAGWQAHRAALDAHQPFRDFAFSRLDTDGTERHISVSGDAVFDASGAFRGYRGVGTDITGRKRAEEQLRNLSRAVEQSPVSIFITDTSGTIEYVNPKFTEVTGYSLEEARGRNPRILKSDLTPPQTYAQLWQTIARGKTWRGEICNRKKNGELYWESASISGLVDERGKVVHFIAVKEDITERKRLEAENRALTDSLEQRVAERTAELQAANRQLEGFTYSVSHDLRGPLRAIAGFNELLLESADGRLGDEDRQLLGRVGRNVRRMNALIDDLLAFSRVSRMTLVRAPIELDRLARAVAAELKEIQAHGRVQVAPLPPVWGDHAMVRQVLVNLIGNALKFSSRREQPQVEVGHTQADGETVFFVRDNGAGFDMRYAKNLFGVFQRLHRAEEFEGTGVGLAIVHQVIQRHGGRIWAEAALERGATFFFTLPLAPANAS